MNNSYQAKSGFKTFIFVFLISLGIFSVFYYLTSSSGKSLDIENYSAPREDVLGEAVEKTAFEDLSKQKMLRPVVLGGADVRDTTETTESTSPVPDTGISSITIALISGGALFAFGIYALRAAPRRVSLATFEKNVTKD